MQDIVLVSFLFTRYEMAALVFFRAIPVLIYMGTTTTTVTRKVHVRERKNHVRCGWFAADPAAAV